MNKKRGFALVESIFMIVFLSVALLLVYKAFATSFQDERRRVNYDNTDTIYKTYFLKQYFEENGILTYLPTATFTNGFLELDCSTISSVNKEYCDFLMEPNNLDVKKIYITKYDMSNVNYNNLEATTIDYMKTLSGSDTSSYRIIVWFNNNEYASLKIGEPFFTLNIILDGGTWSGEPSQRMNSGDSVNISDPVKEGYTFNGWTVTGVGSTASSGVFTMGHEDTILVANWIRPISLFTYTGGEQTYTIPFTGYYNLKTWGAQGGNIGTTGTYNGGYGGYSTGVVYLTSGTTIYIYVGGKGTDDTVMNSAATPGGYNGGGQGFGYTDKYVGGGGGATHIATSSGLLSALSSNQSAILVVAGGGGGAGYQSSSYYGHLGHGGGFKGTSSTVVGSSPNTGGTQAAPGTGYYPGSFGSGASCSVNGCAGGGGGYYGGGAGQYYGGGSGGSGYIANPLLLSYGSTTKAMYCYNCTESAGTDSKTISTSNVSATPTENYAKSGDGYAIIQYLGNESPTQVVAGDYINYDSIEKVQNFTAPYSGYYKLETWGAQGGNIGTTGTYNGGYGSYSTGVVYLTSGTTIYIYSGGRGSDDVVKDNAATPGGYNGGGNGWGYTDKYVGGGGGATHIATTTGLLSTLSSNQSAILIVAGGGGGAAQESASYYGHLGHGGGFNGVATTRVGTVASTGGTQTAGGTGTYVGGFGYGATCSVNGCAGGGGGYYGGGSGSYAGGGSGGSGYIANTSLISYGSTTKAMYCYNCTTSATESTLTYTTTNVSSSATSNYAKAGGGFAKITYLGS